MHIDRLRQICLGFPGVREQIQWQDHLLFKVGGKMFAITSLEPARVWLSLKASEESFADLTERPGIIPAPYLARAKWIAFETPEAVSPTELHELLRISYDLIVAKLPRKKRESLLNKMTGRAARSAKKPRKTRKHRKPKTARGR